MSAAPPTCPRHEFTLLVLGPAEAGRTSLMRAVSQSPVAASAVESTGPAGLGEAPTAVGTYLAGDVRLLLLDASGRHPVSSMPEIDAAVYVVDAQHPASHIGAALELRVLLKELQVTVVVAVDRCDAPEEADRIAHRLSARSDQRAMPCHLGDPSACRSVVVAALTELLAHIECPSSVGQVGTVDQALRTGGRR